MKAASTEIFDDPGAEGEPEVITGSREQLLRVLSY
jgi:hypothetical protein